MHVLVRTYAHSRKASFVSIAGTVLSLIFFAAAALSMFNCYQVEQLSYAATTLLCIALGILCFQGSRRLADHVALRALEKKLGKPIIENH